MVCGSEIYIAPSIHAATWVEINMSKDSVSDDCRSYEMLPRVTVFYINQYRLPTEGGLRESQTLADIDVRSYYNVRQELTVHNSLVFKHNRIVVPRQVCEKT